MRTVSTFVLGLSLLTAGAAPAVAQSAGERLDAALDRAAEAGIPVVLLESKVAEGRAKGVPMDRIAAAVEQRAAALATAMEAIGNQNIGLASLALAAEAIEGGVSRIALQAIVESAPQDRRSVAVAVLGHLVTQGHAPEAALEAVRGALGRPDSLANLLNVGLPEPAAAVAAGPPAGVPPVNAPPARPGPPAGVPPSAPPTAPGPPEGVPPSAPPTTPGPPEGVPPSAPPTTPGPPEGVPPSAPPTTPGPPEGVPPSAPPTTPGPPEGVPPGPPDTPGPVTPPVPPVTPPNAPPVIETPEVPPAVPTPAPPTLPVPTPEVPVTPPPPPVPEPPTPPGPPNGGPA